MASNRTKNQHYVPQFLLRNFTADETGRLHVFDKRRERAFVASPRNVASEIGFYDFDHGGKVQTLEPMMTELESAASRVISGILQQRSILEMSSTDRVALSAFAAVQLLRVKATRDRIQSLYSSVRAELSKRGIDPGDVVPEMDAAAVKVAGITGIPRQMKEIAKLIHEKAWILHQAPAGTAFYVSDNPVTFHNLIEQPGRGNLGLKSPGVEVYLPISREYSICFLCRDAYKSIKTHLRLAHELKRRSIAEVLDVEPLERVVAAIDSGQPDLLLPDNVVHQNSLQVIFSSRFVFSPDEDFELVESMLRGSPGLKEPPQIVVR